ncbi:MAG TPA: hypothetical protein VD816_03755 [Ohtaekwangia sp.]|nr:hypothetical protein [Ohtaekwangia sp.]
MKPTLLIVLLLMTAAVFSQSRKLRTVSVTDPITQAFVDRTGDFYIQTRDGQIQKFDPDGNFINLYKGAVPPALFDPRDGARLFAYFRGTQQYAYLNPSFDVTALHSLDPAFAIAPWLICSSGDHNVWVLDTADWTIKKLNPKKEHLEAEGSLGFAPDKKPTDLILMREYQGFLFVLDISAGIYVYNGIGKLIRTIPVKGLRTFNFLGEELYYLSGKKLRFLDLFSAEEREMEIPAPASHIILTDERIYAFQGLQISLYKLSSERN